jgi:hypothetical protein
MKELPKEISKKGFIYTQIKRKKNIAIYEQKSNTLLKQKPSYEVIKIKAHKGLTIADTYLPPSEMYPPSTQWGVAGFTYSDLEAAEERFNQLLHV